MLYISLCSYVYIRNKVDQFTTYKSLYSQALNDLTEKKNKKKRDKETCQTQ